MARLQDLTTSTPGLQAGVGVLSARLKEFIESKSKQALIANVRMDKQEQVRLYVRGGSGRALFLTIEKAIGDFEMRIQRELPHEAVPYESWMQRARWQLLTLETLVVLVCVYFTRVLGFPKKPRFEGRSFQLLP